jgi:hypothetical protein
LDIVQGTIGVESRDESSAQGWILLVPPRTAILQKDAYIAMEVSTGLPTHESVGLRGCDDDAVEARLVSPAALGPADRDTCACLPNGVYVCPQVESHPTFRPEYFGQALGTTADPIPGVAVETPEQGAHVYVAQWSAGLAGEDHL